jgi:hypothetical protein
MTKRRELRVFCVGERKHCRHDWKRQCCRSHCHAGNRLLGLSHEAVPGEVADRTDRESIGGDHIIHCHHELPILHSQDREFTLNSGLGVPEFTNGS